MNTNLITKITSSYGENNSIIVKKFFIGNSSSMEAFIIYNKLLTKDEIINNNILKVLMLHFDEKKLDFTNLPQSLCENYIAIGECYVENNINSIIDSVNEGKTILIVQDYNEAIIINTSGGEYRSIQDTSNESAVRGTREGFVEKLETNISLLKRRISDKTLTEEYFVVGRRSSTKLALLYIKDIADDNIINTIRERLNKIDVDFIPGSGMIEQYVEDSTYSPFPQILTTERCDIILSGMMEGRAAIIVDGTPFVLLAPALFISFFQAVEDYYQRTLISSFTRIIRTIAAIIVILLTPLYLTTIRYNSSLIPTTFIFPLAQSRQGIALPPFLEILLMELIVEFLREGGLRLPPKIAQTLSIVGGIIIGNAALQAKISSPTTLLVVGVSTACSFLIPNYEMALTIRFLKFPMLFMADAMGFIGIGAGFYLILIHLLSVKSFNIPYFTLNKADLKDAFIRVALWKMKETPASMPNKNKKRQSNFRDSMEGNRDEG